MPNKIHDQNRTIALPKKGISRNNKHFVCVLDPRRKLILDVCLTACLGDCADGRKVAWMYIYIFEIDAMLAGCDRGKYFGPRGVRITRTWLILMRLREALKRKTRASNWRYIYIYIYKYVCVHIIYNYMKNNIC